MRRLAQLVFDDAVVGTEKAYTAFQFNNRLGRYDNLAVQVVVDEVSGTGPAITVEMDHCCDGRNWIQKLDTAGAAVTLVNQSLSSTATNSFFGYDDSGIPSLTFVRLTLRLSGETPRAKVKAWVTVRDNA